MKHALTYEQAETVAKELGAKLAELAGGPVPFVLIVPEHTATKYLMCATLSNTLPALQGEMINMAVMAFNHAHGDNSGETKQ